MSLNIPYLRKRSVIKDLLSNFATTRRESFRANVGHFCFEGLESRRLLASVFDAGTTLNIALAANESLSLQSNGSTYQFNSDKAFNETGIASSSDFSAFGGNTLQLLASGIARYSTIQITDAAAGARVTFAASGVNSYSESLIVTLDSGSAAPVLFDGPSFFATGANVQITTDNSITVNSRASLIATGNVVLNANAGISLSGGVQSVDGQVTINADFDGNGTGTLALNDSPPSNFVDRATLVDSDAGDSDFLSSSRALSGDGNTAAFSSPGDNVGGLGGRGSVSVFVKSGTGWTQQQKLVDSTGSAGDGMGKVALSADGNTLLVGIPADGVDGRGEQGSALIYTRSGGVWTQQTRLLAPNGAILDRFGSSVSLSPDGSMAIVTAPRYEVGTKQDQGAAFVYLRSGNTWSYSQTLVKSNGVAQEFFGGTVVINRDGTTAVITAFSRGTGLSLGSAVVFTRSGTTWTEQQILVDRNRAFNDGFGASVDMSADASVIVIGTIFDRIGGLTDYGSAQVFIRSGNSWIQQQQLIAPDGTVLSNFGGAVAVSANGNIILVSAVGATFSQESALYAFTRRGSSWTLYQKLIGSSNAVRLGAPLLNAEGTMALISAPFESLTQSNQGSIHVFDSQLQDPAGWIDSSGPVTLAAADYDLRSSINSLSNILFKPSLSGRAFDLGTNSAGNMGLTDAELDRVTAPTITLGETSSGSIIVSAPINRAFESSQLLLLNAGGNISFTGAGSLVTGNINLRMNASSIVSGTATTDINTGTGSLLLVAGAAGIGTSDNALTIAGAKLATLTTGNGNQFFALSGTVVIDTAGLSAGNGTITLNDGILALAANEQIDNNSQLAINGTFAQFSMTTFNETVSRLFALNGAINTTANSILTSTNTIETQNAIIRAILAGSNGLRQSGSGTTGLIRNNSYSGTTTVVSGTLNLSSSTNNPIANSQLIDVQSGGTLDPVGLTFNRLLLVNGQTLQGAGNVGRVGLVVDGGSRLSPGPGPATLSTRNVQINSGGSLDIDLAGTAPTQFDQLKVVGTFSISGQLNLNVSFDVAAGSQFKIVDNDGTDSVGLSFENLPEGTVFSSGTGAQTKYFRISYVGGDGNDVVLTAMSALALAISPVSISEKNGYATGVVSRGNSDSSVALTVTLTSSDTSEATVPNTVTIPVGSSSVSFIVSAVDDALLDGTQNVTISANANGFLGTSQSIQVLDSETLAVTIFPNSISENGGAATGIVTRSNTDIANALVVSLSSSDTSEATAPASVTIPANQSSATFVVMAVDDTLLDGSINVTINATTGGYESVPGTVTVTDFETLSLVIGAPTIDEQSGSTTATISRSNSDNTQPLTITLSSSDTSEATVPGSVTILAGQSVATFTVTAVDDSLLDGSQVALISANANGYIGAAMPITVTDVETLTISIQPASISEKEGSATATLSRSNTDISQALIVALSSSDTSEATVPSTVTIPAGQSSTTFIITAQDDQLLDGTQTVVVSASANGYVSGARSFEVTDWETLNVALAISSIREDGGVTTSTVTRSNTDIAQPLIVSLSSSDTREATVPTSVTIAAGQTSATFVITAVDDALLDGPQFVSITASAAGYVAGSNSLTVLDAEQLLLTINVSSMSEFGGRATGTIARSNTDVTQPITIALTSGDTSEATVPNTVTIPANQTSTTFTILAVDDNLLDGTQTVLFRASALGYIGGSKSIDVTDFETLSLAIAPNTISEKGGLATGTVSRSNTNDSLPITVQLVSNDPTEATVPVEVVIPAGQESATFPVTALDDDLLDGTQAVNITSTSTGYVAGANSIQIADYESMSITIDKASISELGGTTTGTVTRSNTDIQSALTVQLLSSDLTEASVPATVTLLAGQSSVSFSITAADDNLLDGEQSVTISASASGFVGGSALIKVTDHEALSLNLASNSVVENGGTTTATIARNNTDNSQAIAVSIISSDTTEATTPATVTIPAGQSSTTFTITAQDDSLLDGVQAVTITASASGYVNASQEMSVIDHETFSVSIDKSVISEQGGFANGTVRRSNTDTSNAITVALISSDTGEATVPASVTILPNQSSATFTITAVDDGLLDGAQTVSISATAPGYISGNASIIVADGVSLALNFDVTSISERGGVAIGTVTRTNTNISEPLTVTLLSSNTSEATVPPSVMIPAGQSSTTFSITAADDALLDGPQSVTITVEASGYLSSSRILTITDYETLSLSLNKSSMSELGGTAVGRVTRSNIDVSQAIIVTLSSSDSSEATVPPTVTIPAGQNSVTFAVTATDDALLDGSQIVTLSVSRLGYVGDAQTIEVTDAEALGLAIRVSSLSENGGTTNGTITRSNTDISAALTVSLSSSDLSEATVPRTVTIPGGQPSASFSITAIDDELLDGLQTVIISVTAVGYAPASSSIDVTDAESLRLSLNSNAMSENGGSISASITRSNTDITLPLLVNLSSSDLSEATVPVTVAIPAGQPSVSFNINAVDDSLLDGLQTVIVSATARGYEGASKPIDILDAETISLIIDRESLSENGGLATATVSRSNTDIASPIIVSIISGDTSEASVPSTITIPGGQSSADFTVTAIDDAILDGTQSIEILVSALGYSDSSKSINVSDAESLTLNLSSTTISENGGVILANLTRSNTDVALALVVTLTSSDLTEAIVPAMVTIPSGQTSIEFTIAALDDTLLDGEQSVTISANAIGYFGAVRLIDVSDAETLMLSLANPAIRENGGLTEATVIRSNSDLTSAISIAILSSDTSEAIVPSSITIPPGQTSANFTIQAIDDELLDGVQSVRISVLSTGYFSSSKVIDVTDVETLTLSISSLSISEDSSQTIATVTRNNADIATALTVLLSSSDTSELVVPATVTLPAGQASFSFTVLSVDDALLDGTQAVNISARAMGYVGDSRTIQVLDAESFSIQIGNTTISEEGGTTTATITRSNTDTNQPLVINLTSNDTSEALVPATVTIPANQANTSFTITAVDDRLLDGVQIVSLNASAIGYSAVSNQIQVSDSESLTLSLNGTTMSENGGSLLATLSRSNTDMAAPLAVSIFNSDTSEATVPLSITIPPGQDTISFRIAAVDDALLDGAQIVTLRAHVEGYSDGSTTLNVTDSESLSLTLTLPAIGENGDSSIATLSRSNTDNNESLLVSISSSSPSRVNFPTSVLIPSGQTSITFLVTGVDNTRLEGSKLLAINASAIGYVGAESTLEILDFESLSLSEVTVSISEDGGSTLATVTRNNTNIESALDVAIFSSDTSEAKVPSLVTIPAGQTFASFTITGVDDSLLDGTQTLEISVSAIGYVSDKRPLSVNDAETLTLVVDQSTFSERRGTATATIRRSNTDNAASLSVELFSSDTSEATVPAIAIIPAGQESTTFNVVAVDDLLFDGMQTAIITATASQYSSASVTVQVTDNDRKFPWSNPRNKLDVNDSGSVTPLDALLVINALSRGFRLPPQLPDPFIPVQYLDVSSDGLLSPLDALLVINELNRKSQGEGETDLPPSPMESVIDILANDPIRKRRVFLYD